MAKNRVLLYYQIWDFVAQEFIEKLSNYDGEDTEIRINSPGGNVFAGWGMTAVVSEFEGKLTAKVDGVAASMAAYLLLFCDNVECLDISKIMLHPASGHVESEEDQSFLDSVNKDLKAKMKLKFNAETFEKIAGYTIDEMFSENKELWLNAKQAKKLGIVNKINRLDPANQQAFAKFAACGNFTDAIAAAEGGEPDVNWSNIAKAFES
jgi:ATP-dependent Clp protease protease subunit